MDKIALNLEKLLSGENLRNELEALPDYSTDIQKEDAAYRLISLEDIYKIYVPSDMSVEIYNKLYLAVLHSLNKKQERIMVAEQQYENRKRILGNKSLGIIGGSDSFTIIGSSGIGKSSAIFRAIDLITNGNIIEIDKPYKKIIPCVIVQCPFDCSVKGLLLEILRKVDEVLDTAYYINSVKQGSTTDMLIGTISQVSINHIGLLIVDEIQNVVNNKNGQNLIAMLTQLINNSGISICMVGTPESEVFFERVDYLARRTIGLRYTNCSYGEFFTNMCRKLFEFQYTEERVEVNDSIIDWLFEHSGGIVSNVISLFHDSQEIAILNGYERIDLQVLNEAYKKRMNMLHGFIASGVNTRIPSKPKKERFKLKIQDDIECTDKSIFELVNKAKRENIDVVSLLKESSLLMVI